MHPRLQNGPSRHHHRLFKLGADVASHYAGRATDEIYGYGKRKGAELIHNYMKHATKRAHPRDFKKKHHKTHIHEKPVIDSMELQATGCEHESFTYRNKLPKKAHLLKALSRPIIHRDTTGVTLVGPSGECNYLELSNTQRVPMTFRLNEAITQATLTSPATSLFNTQVLYKSLKLKRTLTNQHNEPVYVMWHEWLAKTAQNTSPFTLANVQSGQEGATSNTTTGAGVNFPDTDMRVYTDLRRNFKLMHRRRVYLKPGETIVYYTNLIFNKFLTYQFINTDMTTNYIAGLVHCTTYQVQGASASTVTTGGAITLNRFKINVVEVQETQFVPYPLPTVKLSRFDSINSLAVNATAGTTRHVNVDGGVIEIDGDA